MSTHRGALSALGGALRGFFGFFGTLFDAIFLAAAIFGWPVVGWWTGFLLSHEFLSGRNGRLENLHILAGASLGLGLMTSLILHFTIEVGGPTARVGRFLFGAFLVVLFGIAFVMPIESPKGKYLGVGIVVIGSLAHFLLTAIVESFRKEPEE